jgi:hypothetical protein
MVQFNYFLLAILFIFSYSAGCKRSSDPEKEKLDTIMLNKHEAVPENNSTLFDTLAILVGSPHVVAFSMTQEEYRTLSQSESVAYDGGYKNLKYYFDKFANTEEGKSIQCSQTVSRYIIIGKSLLDRKTLGSDFGLILIAKAGNYEIVNSGLSDSEIIHRLNAIDLH